MVNQDVDVYNTSLNHLENTPKLQRNNNVLKTKRILKNEI